ncbi:DUF4153 domain-containing protein [Kitasatospora purpeofusca]|uniref:DUF4153 domain-containing protein n=1 Tax=Kitasatospora purpeofusca TaxID=67352 RepID=UPI002257B0BD|nr:DUF4173 domain-containing protein [Kitasatospora purpeofusca]MCX4757704.1 DUF4173 domain-containing protein [Kitasatospora purpeofusca]WSR34591.1 DUF4173 domain-containing protein [Kitasatospora purpeofusca]
MSGFSVPAADGVPPRPGAGGAGTGAGADAGAGVPAAGPTGAFGPAGGYGPGGHGPGGHGPGGYGPGAGPYRAPGTPAPQPFQWLRPSDPERKAPATGRTVLAAVLAGLLSSWLLIDGLGVDLLLGAAVVTVGAGAAARAAGRRPRAWTVLWSALALALLAVPALYEAGWPVLLSTVSALGLASLALHGGRRWSGVLLALPGLLWQLVPGLVWGGRTLRGRRAGNRGQVVPVLKGVLVAVVLLTVFGALFAGADAAMANVLEGLVPSVDLGELPARAALFVLGLATALGFAHIAAGPRRWDRTVVRPGRARGRLEWALPLAALNLMFGAFVVLQAVVVLGGAEAVLERTGMSRSEYARQGFWQLLVVTVLTLVVVALAKRWAPRGTEADRRMVRLLLGALCLLTLVVVAAALGRMWFYVDASGLTSLRLWVLTVEIWLGVVFVLLIVAGLTPSAGWLPRAAVLSAVAAAAVYGLMGPDAMVAEQNVARFERTGQIDLRNVRSLSVDAVPALDRLPGDYRTCALNQVAFDLRADSPAPWYATSLAESRARAILAERPSPDRLTDGKNACDRVGMSRHYAFEG